MGTYIKKYNPCTETCDECEAELVCCGPCSLYTVFGGVTSIAYSVDYDAYPPVSGTLSFNIGDCFATDGVVSIEALLPTPPHECICEFVINVYPPYPDPSWTVVQGAQSVAVGDLFPLSPRGPFVSSGGGAVGIIRFS
jgi:hypothetical protein